MSVTYPGVYIQELPSSVHTIVGVSTSVAAFVGYTPRGIDNRAQELFNFGDYNRLYGGLSLDSELGYAVQQFFQNGGTQAYVVRVPRNDARAANVVFDSLTFTALSSGAWTNGKLLIDVDFANVAAATPQLAFNLTITDLADNIVESFPNVTVDSTQINYVVTVVNDPDNGSQLVSVAVGTPAPTAAPTATGIVGSAITVGTVNDAFTGNTTGTTVTTEGDLTIALTPASATPPQLLPGGSALSIPIFLKNTSIPQTVAGLAVQLGQAINACLAVAWPGATVACSVATVTGGQAIRVNALLPNMPDAALSFSGNAAQALELGGGSGPSSTNVAHYTLGSQTAGANQAQTSSQQGGDGSGLPQTAALQGNQGNFTGIYALSKVAFNLLSIPDATRAAPVNSATPDPNINTAAIYSTALTFCNQNRAFLFVDPPPNVTTVAGAIDWISNSLPGIAGADGANAAAYWPRPRIPDQLNNYNLRSVAPSGTVAGIYANTDGASGVWTAAAGTGAALSNVQSMTYQMSDPENGQLNPLGLNCLRTFPVYGPVVWGARTLAGANALGNQWKYVPIRRMALFIEQSLYQSTQWAVFQPNDEPLWAALRLNISSFMQTYFLKGAFEGQSPDQAYFVKCDAENNPQASIDAGIVNVLVGFAPLYPAEFVVIQIEQLAGQS